MVKRFSCIFFLLLALLPCLPVGKLAGQNTYFNNTYDFYGMPEAGFNVVPVDGGYLIVGGVIDSMLLVDIALLHIDSFGNEVWKKDYGSPDLNEYPGRGGGMTPVSGGGYALAGSISYPSGDSDVMLWRFDANGDTLWTKTYIDTSNERIGTACVQATDGGFVITGFGDGGCLLLMKTDSMGEVQWNNCYNDSLPGLWIDLSSDGGYVVGGASNAQASVTKFDSSGSLQWTKTYGGPLSRWAVVRSTSDGGYIIAGDTVYELSSSSTRVYAAKLDSAGDMVWGHPYGPVTNSATTLATMVRELGDGSYIIAADVGGGYNPLVGLRSALIKVSPDGDSLWMRYIEDCYGDPLGDGLCKDLRITDDGGFIITGVANTSGVCATSQNIWVVKTNCLGFPEPPTPYFTDSLNDPGAMEVSFANMSRYSDSIKVSFGDGDTAMFVNPQYTYAVALLPDLDTVNYFTHTYPDTGTYIVTATGWACGDTGVFVDTVYILQYVGVEEFAAGNKPKLRCFPNPFSEYTTIEAFVPKGINHAKVLVFNTLGITIREYPVKEGYNALTLLKEDLPDAGVYFYALYGYGKLLEQDKLVIIK